MNSLPRYLYLAALASRTLAPSSPNGAQSWVIVSCTSRPALPIIMLIDADLLASTSSCPTSSSSTTVDKMMDTSMMHCATRAFSSAPILSSANQTVTSATSLLIRPSSGVPVTCPCSPRCTSVATSRLSAGPNGQPRTQQPLSSSLSRVGPLARRDEAALHSILQLPHHRRHLRLHARHVLHEGRQHPCNRRKELGVVLEVDMQPAASHERQLDALAQHPRLLGRSRAAPRSQR